MERMHVKYLLVGGGVASQAAARAIRERDPREAIMLVAQEIARPYNRAALSKSYLRRETEKRQMLTEQFEWFSENHVLLRTGRRVVRLDVPRQMAHIDNGDEIFYDQLLLATGSISKHLTIPGAELPNVFYLKTIADADRLHHAIEISRKVGHNRACVIGAGLLGVEVAGSLAKVGMHVDLIQSRAIPWPRIAGEQTGQFIARQLRAAGVKIHGNSRAMRVEGDGRVQRVILSDHTTLASDFVVAAVGSVANREILRDTPISAEASILVDQRCRTNVPNIYAAGDCCAIYDVAWGKHRTVTHWSHADVTGQVAGHNMSGAEESYSAVTQFTSEIAGRPIEVFGDARFVHHRILRGNALNDGGDFAELGITQDDRVAQIIRVGREAERETLARMANRIASVAGYEEALKDPDVMLDATWFADRAT